MARPPRLEFPGAVYHVTARGNERRAVFRDTHDRERYLTRVAIYREKFRFQLLAFCLMSNHLHLAIRTGQAGLSRIMAGLQSSYAQWFNRRHNRVGHLFQGRYGALLVQEERHLFALLRYIHLNPVRAGIVEKPEDYTWSSDRWFRQATGPEWLDLDASLQEFGKTRQTAVRRYAALMADGSSSSYSESPAVGQVVKGDVAFANVRFEEACEIDPPLKGISEGRVVDAVSRVVGVHPADVREGKRSERLREARCLAAYIGKRFGGISRARMARYVQRDESSLVQPVARLERAIDSDPVLRRRVDRIVRDLRDKSSPQA